MVAGTRPRNKQKLEGGGGCPRELSSLPEPTGQQLCSFRHPALHPADVRNSVGCSQDAHPGRANWAGGRLGRFLHPCTRTWQLSKATLGPQLSVAPWQDRSFVFALSRVNRPRMGLQKPWQERVCPS